MQGNVLVVEEANSTSPDDTIGSQWITFMLRAGAPSVKFGGYSAVDDARITALLGDQNGTPISGSTLTIANDNETGSVSFSPVTIDPGESFTFRSSSSFGLDNVVLVPLPAAGWLLIAAFGGLFGAKRLRARA